MLASRLKERLVDALLRVPGADDRSGRTALMQGIPDRIQAAITRSDNQFTDLARMIDQLETLGRLANGERPVVIVTHNGWRRAQGTELGESLAELENEVEAAYGGDEPLAELPDRPEVLISGGTGEWVTSAFIEQAQLAGTRVARLLVPRYSGGNRMRPPESWGTGWLIAPRLLLTNHHVIEARDQGEQPAPERDFARQGEEAQLWFDYHREGLGYRAVGVTEVVDHDRDLDYALLRLPDSPALSHREQLAVARDRPDLPQGARLNIVQCPGGGPLRYAIRNNFFVGPGRRPYQMRYLTDTLKGSSGSPVLNDNWQVVALHHGYKKVDPGLYQDENGKTGLVKYHNEGILLSYILDHLPTAVRDEIGDAQGWPRGA
jgi:endonuclease G, mitochondrial